MDKSTFELIYDVVKQIPKGKVATYGQVASLAGNRRWSRVVGYVLHANPDPEHIPCHPLFLCIRTYIHHDVFDLWKGFLYFIMHISCNIVCLF